MRSLLILLGLVLACAIGSHAAAQDTTNWKAVAGSWDSNFAFVTGRSTEDDAKSEALRRCNAFVSPDYACTVLAAVPDDQFIVVTYCSNGYDDASEVGASASGYDNAYALALAQSTKWFKADDCAVILRSDGYETPDGD
ncbi:DUF4189 domain-containing protein [Devosia sp. Root105]|uniref:DUF4189 domain-containing protein n=1 Tax=Devosia sp. Root105 TaxID=1736423 RepID=UPI0006F95524|nr:DUF4189 domain-containing protein [Devosia sp. Root105]KQU98924.1 hypothetical protein ASC68_05910 [Devosia sp. Root105]